MRIQVPPSRISIRLMYLRGLICTVPRLFAKAPRTFAFAGQRYDYFSHRYNWTWMNERTVELPLALGALQKASPGKILEVGNVISHYHNEVQHDIVDRYERGNPRILNIDARVFKPLFHYDMILSLSTLEHVGWDESPRDPAKAWQTIRHLCSLLAPGGTFIFTVPAGYHPALDRSILDRAHVLGPLRALKRISNGNEWEECSPEEAGRCKFGNPFPFANAIFFCSADQSFLH